MEIINSQPDENKITHPRSKVDIQEVFLTIQGEGPFHGKPAVFIRTAGCNLSSQCKNCDTDYTSRRKLLEPPKIVSMVQELRPNGLVVLTGGEPFRQDIGPLVRMLLNTGYQVQIETNGTYYWANERDASCKVTIVCSPKTPKLHPMMLGWISAYKYVVTSGEIDPDDGLPLSVLGSGIRPARPHSSDIEVYVAPADLRDEQKNEENLRAAVQSVMQFGYRLSLQEHKMLGMP